jgi:RNA polymerase sigma-70 factor, ECF subfamily
MPPSVTWPSDVTLAAPAASFSDVRLPGAPMEQHDLDLQLGRAWREHRRYVLDIGLRMLGSLSEAEDVVQEAFARLMRVDIDEIEDVRGWLVVVVSRLCLDRLRAARRHPTTPGWPSDTEPADRALDPSDRVTLDDSVRLALNVVLERLTPAERTAFVLHDVFQYPFETVGEIVGRSPAACRQLASRARRTIHSDGTTRSFAVETAEQRRVTDQFIAACTTGDVDGLLAVLDPDVAGQADLGGTIGLLPPVVGRDEVARNALTFLGPAIGATLLSLPGGFLALRDNRVYAVVTLRVRDGRVNHIDAVVDPASAVA